MSIHIAFRQNGITEFMTSDKLCQILVLCYCCLTVTTPAVSQEIQLKRFWKPFFNTLLTTTINTATCNVFIYLSIFLFFLCRNFKIIGLSPSGKFCFGSQVMPKHTKCLPLTPHPPPSPPRN